MARKSAALIALLVCAVAQVNGLALDEENFTVEGKVYCDPCRLQFETKLSRPLPGVTVRLECKKIEDGSLSYSIEGKTDKDGQYNLMVEGDHEEENCELKTLHSSHPDCSDSMDKLENSDRVVLTKNMGVPSMTRFVNSLGFMTKTVDSKCAEMIKEMGYSLGKDGQDDLF